MDRINIEKIKIYVPQKKEKNLLLDKKFKKQNGFYQKVTGIIERRVSNKIETTEYMAIKAVNKLIKRKIKISHIISVTNTPSILFPSLAHHVFSFFSKFLPKNVHCVGLNAGCSGYVDALILASELLSKTKGKILIVTSDNYTKYISKSDKSILPLFGDGATASIVSNSNGLIISSKYSETVPKTINDLCFTKIENNYLIKMNGPEVLLFTIKNVIPKLKNIIKKNKTNLLFLHQPNKIVLDRIEKSLNKKNYILPRNYEKIGNTVSSSIPILISQNWKLFKKFRNILIAGFGVGLTHSYILLKKN